MKTDQQELTMQQTEEAAELQATAANQEANEPQVKEVETVEEQTPEVEPQATPEEAAPCVEVSEEEASADQEGVQVDELSAEQEEQRIAEMNLQELCDKLVKDIEELPILQLRTPVEQTKIAFYKKVKAVDDAKKAAFIEAGGDVDEYKAEISAEEIRFKELLMLYRNKRDQAFAKSEEQKEANYKAKLEIIEELKTLVNSTETLGQTFATFRELQTKWKEIGIVPMGVTKDLWETYHHHTENFYNFVKINKELRDIDLKRNYETKLSLCEQAEALFELPSAVSAFNELQKLHDLYREAGPVALEFKEQLWERFKAASSRVNKRHQEHYDVIKEEQERNLALKKEICEKVEGFSALPLVSAKEWNEVQDQVTELQKVWKTIGFAPKKDNNAIYERFRAACDKFFDTKREFFAGMRTEMDDNLQLKTDLCVQAEALSESEDWKATTDALVELQKEWKKIGPVSRKYSDSVWKRFRAACDKFFERKSEHFKGVDGQYTGNLEAKLAVIEELKAMQGSEELTFDTLKEVMQRYSAIGFVPIRKKEALAKEYKKVCDSLFEFLRAKEGSSRIEKYRQKVSAAKAAGESRNVGSDREKMLNKLRNLEAEVKLLENNIGFFGSSKGASALVADVERKIEKVKGEMAEIIQKIKIIDQEA